MSGKTKAGPGQGALPIDVSDAVGDSIGVFGSEELGLTGVEEEHALSGAESASGGGETGHGAAAVAGAGVRSDVEAEGPAHVAGSVVEGADSRACSRGKQLRAGARSDGAATRRGGATIIGEDGFSNAARGEGEGGLDGSDASAPTPEELRAQLERAMAAAPAGIPRLRELLLCLPGAEEVGYAGLGQLPRVLDPASRACMGALLELYARGVSASVLAEEGVDSAACPLPALEAYVCWEWAGAPVGAEDMARALVAAGGRVTRARDGSQIVMFGRVRTTVAEALACAGACGATSLGALRASAGVVPPASCAPLFRRVWPAVAAALAEAADERLRAQLSAARSAWYVDALAKGTLCCPHCGRPIVADAD